MFKKHVSLLTLLLLVPIAACDDSTDVGDPGTLSLLLTDAPGDFTQAIVTIKRIELVGDGQPLVLEDVPFTTDLLMLSNDVASLLEDETIPGGTYSELRFIIPEACIGIEQSDGSEAIYASSGFADCGAQAVPAVEVLSDEKGFESFAVEDAGAQQCSGPAHAT